MNVCNICQLEAPMDIIRKVQPTRKIKAKSNAGGEEYIFWIECDVCKSWSHALRSGLTAKDCNNNNNNIRLLRQNDKPRRPNTHEE